MTVSVKPRICKYCTKYFVREAWVEEFANGSKVVSYRVRGLGISFPTKQSKAWNLSSSNRDTISDERDAWVKEEKTSIRCLQTGQRWSATEWEVLGFLLQPNNPKHEISHLQISNIKYQMKEMCGWKKRRLVVGVCERVKGGWLASERSWYFFSNLKLQCNIKKEEDDY